MERGWLKEALFAGQTANGFKLGTAMTMGWFWMSINGCRLVYRGGSMETIDFDEPLVVAGPDEKEITLPDFVTHEAGNDYFYVVRNVNQCGRIEQTLKAAVKVTIDEEGGLRGGRPNGVFGLAARQKQDGQAEIVWGYNPIKQAVGPKETRIYSDGGTGQVDYQEPIAAAPYKGRRFYQHKSELPAGGRYRFAVRAADNNGSECESMKIVEIETSQRNVEAIEIVGVI
jgi:hypothetical protein